MFLSRNVINVNVTFPSSLTFLVPGQVPGAGHTHCSIGQCIRPAGILIKCSVAHKTWKTTINVKVSTALLAELDRQDQYVTWPLIRGLSSVFQHTSLNITSHHITSLSSWLSTGSVKDPCWTYNCDCDSSNCLWKDAGQLTCHRWFPANILKTFISVHHPSCHQSFEGCSRWHLQKPISKTAWKSLHELSIHVKHKIS